MLPGQPALVPPAYARSVAEALHAAVVGRTDVYARGFPKREEPGKVGYYPVLEPLTPAVWERHLHGKILLGIYTLEEGNTTRFFCLDFDAPKGSQDGAAADDAAHLAAAWDQAERQAQRFEEAGLQVALEVSRSGRGAHVWGFFDEPVSAADVRTAIKPLLLREGLFDRLFPLQSALTPRRPYGNLLAAPYFGACAGTAFQSELGLGVARGGSVFRNRDTLEPMPPQGFLEGLYTNNAAVLAELVREGERLARAARPRPSGPAREPLPVLGPDGTPGDPGTEGRPPYPIGGLFKLISAYGCRFMHHVATHHADHGRVPEPQWYAALGQLSVFRRGEAAARAISETRAHEFEAKYQNACDNPPVGCAYIHEHFPELACPGCPMRAPYHQADQPILKLVKDSGEPMERPTGTDTMARVRARRAGTLSAGIRWGLAGLDDYTRLRNSELTVAGAPPSIGKTALMVDAMLSIARAGVDVYGFSAETARGSLEERLLANLAGIDSKALRNERRDTYGRLWPLTDDELARLDAAAEELAGLPIHLHYSACEPERILQLVEDAILRAGRPLRAPRVLFMDYLQFGATDIDANATPYRVVSKLVSEFKYIAKILDCPVVLFSQIKRDADGDEYGEIDWFKDTGRIEADMDVGLIITGERVIGAQALRFIKCVKQREGDAGWLLKTILHQAIGRFEAVRGAGAEPPPPDDLFGQDKDVYEQEQPA